MISFGNAASSHSGLIQLKTASQTNFINLHSASQVSVFARNLVRIYKFHTLDNPQISHHKYILQVSRTLKTGKAFKQSLKYNQFFLQILCLQKLFSSFICTCTTSKKIEFASKKGPSVTFQKKSPEYANNRVKKLVIYYNITAILCKSFCDASYTMNLTLTVSALTAICDKSQLLAYSVYFFGK